MIPYLLIALGGAIGSVSRYAVVRLIETHWDGELPIGTLLVNVSGSVLIGLIAGLTDRAWLQQLLMVGVMGGYTTFSSFSLQTVRLLQNDRWSVAGGYILLSVACCIVGTVLGLRLAAVLSSVRP